MSTPGATVDILTTKNSGQGCGLRWLQHEKKKLSKTLLEMKVRLHCFSNHILNYIFQFMKRTKENTEKIKEEEKKMLPIGFIDPGSIFWIFQH